MPVLIAAATLARRPPEEVSRVTGVALVEPTVAAAKHALSGNFTLWVRDRKAMGAADATTTTIAQIYSSTLSHPVTREELDFLADQIRNARKLGDAIAPKPPPADEEPEDPPAPKASGFRPMHVDPLEDSGVVPNPAAPPAKKRAR